jgi:menaquinone-dependent protoporphyrinogen IX oxidase
VFTPILTVFPDDDPSTSAVATEIVSVLREERLETAVHSLHALPPLEPYRAVVLGAPLHPLGWQGSAKPFLVENKETLIRLPVAIFAVMTNGSTPGLGEGRHRLLEELARYHWLHPIAADVFHLEAPAAQVDGSSALAVVPEPVFDLEAVRSWAQLVGRLLTPARARQD